MRTPGQTVRGRGRDIHEAEAKASFHWAEGTFLASRPSPQRGLNIPVVGAVERLLFATKRAFHVEHQHGEVSVSIFSEEFSQPTANFFIA